MSDPMRLLLACCVAGIVTIGCKPAGCCSCSCVDSNGQYLTGMRVQNFVRRDCHESCARECEKHGGTPEHAGLDREGWCNVPFL